MKAEVVGSGVPMAGFRQFPFGVVVACVLTALAFVVGVALGSYYARHVPGSGWLPRRLQFFPVGKLGPGTYYIPYGRKGYYVNLRIVAIHHGKGVRAVQMGDGFPGDHFELDWQRTSHFGVPIAFMGTGWKKQGGWFDVGLRGRLFIKESGHGHGYSLTRLRGKWVKWTGGPNQLIYEGVRYAYDRRTGRWNGSRPERPRAV